MKLTLDSLIFLRNLLMDQTIKVGTPEFLRLANQISETLKELNYSIENYKNN